MGSSASKASRAAAGSAARQYPTRTPPTSTPTTTPSSSTPAATSIPPIITTAPQHRPAAAAHPGPTVRPAPHASGHRDPSINLDASDPDFAQSLRSLGPVQPNPTLSPSSQFLLHRGSDPARRRRGPDPRLNPAVLVLDARARLQHEADVEFVEAGKRGHAGRQFLDVHTIRQILSLRDGYGQSAGRIEQKLGLRKGVVERLGAPGVFGLTTETGRAEQEIRMV